MNKIIIKKLQLKNFKGIKDYTLIPGVSETWIAGANGSGKTTLIDAFRWLLFDKDSKDRADFNIKTLTEDGETIHNLEHTVIAELAIIGELTEVKTFYKTYKEKWTKKRGEDQSSFSGHETLYYMNDLPLKKNEYQAEIAKLLNEDLFKAVTDPFYFAETINWRDRRDTLIAISGNVTNADVVAEKPELGKLNFQFDDISKQKAALAERRKRLNNDIKAIPIRIDECNNSIKTGINFDEIEKDIYVNTCELESVDAELIKTVSVDPAVEEEKKRVSEISLRLFELDNEMVNEYREKERELKDIIIVADDKHRSIERQINQFNAIRINVDSDINHCKIKIDELKEQYTNIQAQRFTPEFETTCPTCKRPFDADFVKSKESKLIENYNKGKAESLARIDKQGKELREKLNATFVERSEVEDKLKASKEVLTAFAEQLRYAQVTLDAFRADNPNGKIESSEKLLTKDNLIAEKRLLEEGLNANNSDISAKLELQRKRKELQDSLNYAKDILRSKQTNEEMQKRIAGLMEDEKKLAKQIQEIEYQQSLADEFTRVQSELLDKRINSKFKFVRFKLFDEQVNGGVAETCEVLVNGVPYKDANNASRVNAGLDVINTLSEYYGVSCPIWIDNRESITTLIEHEAQTINLVVDAEYDKLAIVINKPTTMEDK